MAERLFVGVDGGATRCRARIVDAAGNVLGEAVRNGSANIASRKPGAVLAVIVKTAAAAARRAGIVEDEWRRARAGFGLAGADVQSACDGLRRLFRERGYFRKVGIRTDAYVTWLGAFDGADGAILILGTGSCGLAVVGGRESYVSGYGPEISDEASGQRLGRAAIRRALWALDGRIERSALADAILNRFHESPEEIITFAAKASPADFGAFAPLIFSHGEARDPLALALLRDAAADAERMAARLLDLGASSVYLHGGIAEPLSAWMRPAIRKRLKRPMNVESVPLEGAILLARGVAGRPAGGG